MFTKIKPEEISANAFKLIGSDWMLITAGSIDSYNTMTASWGGFGVLWAKNICWCVIRPQRYTHDFMEKADSFTLSFFSEEYRAALATCGSKSGRDINKAEVCGITPITGGIPQTTAFDEANFILTCKKIYFQDLNPENFLDETIDNNYPQKDYHRMYFGEIKDVSVKE